MNKIISSALLALSLISTSASASIVVSYGSGSALTQTDASMYFDSNYGNTNPWTENGLTVLAEGNPTLNWCGSVNGCAYHFNPQGMSGGNAYGTNLVLTANGLDMHAVEVLVGTGYSYNDFYAVWEAYNDNVLVGSGLAHLFGGTVLGFSGPESFDTLRVGTSYTPNMTTHSYNATAFDNIHVQFGESVPEPTSIALLGLGIAAFVVARRRKSLN